jgi:hypothetical protein
MKGSFKYRLYKWIALVVSMYSWAAPTPGRCAGVTIITHGLEGDVAGWIIPMAESILGTNSICYEIEIMDDGFGFPRLTYAKLGGPDLFDSNNGEIIIKLNWHDFATIDSFLTSSTDIASWFTPVLLATNAIPELRGHPLIEFPIHLVGHSRGGSVVSEISRLLGAQGVWVDHMTFLDPHPLAIPYGDAPVQAYSSVLFADDYWQDIDLITTGEPVAGAYNRQLTSLGGGYDDNHSNVHVWYHGTIDLQTPASYFDVDSGRVISITETMRQTWWNSYELRGDFAGFYYTLLARGDRFSTNRPDGPGTSQIRDGYNQMWDFGAGLSANRTSLPSNNGTWPNVIRLNLTGTNLVAIGQTNTVKLYYQWARPVTSNAIVSIYLDDDFNPYNGNERLMKQVTAPGTTAGQVSSGTVGFTPNVTNATPGFHSVFAKITGGGRTRYLYAPEILTVVSSFQPPRLDIASVNSSQLRVDVLGLPGQRVVLQSSSDFQSWQPFATNWLATNRWSYFANQTPGGRKFYRAALQ